MKIFLDYKKGWYGKFRKLKIYLDGDVHLTDMKQGEQKEVEIPENIQFLFGKMDWKKTEKINVQDFSEGDCLEIIPATIIDVLLGRGGTGGLPIKMMIKNKDGFQK